MNYWWNLINFKSLIHQLYCINPNVTGTRLLSGVKINPTIENEV